MSDPIDEERRYWPEPLLGCAIGGFLIPLVLFIYCVVVLRDVGGPLFWLIIAIPLGLVGFAVGFAVNEIRYRRRKKPIQSPETTRGK
jgi:pilus assembly protein TadC